MGINKRSPRGSTLMFVIVVFTFIMLLTVGLMTVTIASHKNAIYQKEKRQAYFSAKSIVDTCVSYITDDTKSYSEQKELIGIGGNLIDKTSDEVEIRDAQGGIWRSHVDVSATVEGGVPKVKVVGTAKNSNNGVEGTVTAIIREDVSTETSNLVVHSNIDLNIRDQLEIVDILSKGGEVRAIVNSDLSAKTIQSHGVINIQSVNGKLITGDIISGVNNGILEETGVLLP
nr:hypothetical protein [uncultured Niameybacter sp.]